jgi:hypothetical protein
VWRHIAEARIVSMAGERRIVPDRYSVFEADLGALRTALDRAPLEFSETARLHQATLAVPMPDGSTARFRIEESPIMETALANEFPEIKTYVAQGIDDPYATARLDRTPFGFHAMILSPHGTVFVDPYWHGDDRYYLSYYKRDFHTDKQFVCETEGYLEKAADEAFVPNGSTLRTYRLCVAATGEYTAFHGGTVPLAMAAITTSVNRVSGVYERDMAIRMVLIANNSSVVYTNGATDPYSNNNGSTMLGQNQSNLDSVIGNANYDIGHVFSTGGGGVATLGCVCTTGIKARGVTGSPSPVGDAFDIDYVAHEMGHQFGGNHTFNSTTSACAGNRVASAAYEVGSGSTIMAYAGICGADNLQPNSDDYFHGKSYDEIVAYSTTGNGNSCDVETATGNTPPTVDAGPSYTIPRSTPFALTATASDVNGDALTYCWEEFDLGPSGSGTTDNGSSPILRSFDPSTSPTRIFPKLSDILANTTTYGELLPTTNRTMTFRATVRDNRAGGGGVNFDTTTVTSTTSAGPFSVSSHNTTSTLAGTTQITVTWNVANTTAAPVSTASVRILFSADAGATFPFVLAESTPNDGSETVTVPDFATTQGRIKVEAIGNVFFDINNSNLTVLAVSGDNATAGVYIPASGAWFLRNTNNAGPADLAFPYGAGGAGWRPIVGDWNGDGRDTVGAYDPTAGAFYLKNSNAAGAADAAFFFGPPAAGWTPLAGDWDNNGIDTIGLYDPATGNFYLRNSNTAGPADLAFPYGPGGAGWMPVTGDFDTDGDDTIGLYDGAAGIFRLRNSNTAGAADLTFFYGPAGAGWRALCGDYDGDGDATVGLYDPVAGAFYLRNSNTAGPADLAFFYGPAGTTPLIGDWNGS